MRMWAPLLRPLKAIEVVIPGYLVLFEQAYIDQFVTSVDSF